MKRPLRRILTPAERVAVNESLTDRMIQLQTPTMMLDGDRPVWVPGPSDITRPQIAQREAGRLKRVLDEGSPGDLSKAEIRGRDKEIQELEDRVRRKLIPEKAYHHKSDESSEYRKVVAGIVKEMSDPELARDAARLKNLRRERDPHDPQAGTIEHLRRRG